MRFFKSFKLLHRRTKSDPINGVASDFLLHKRNTSVQDEISGPFSTALARSVPHDKATYSHLNVRILDLEAENLRLTNLSAAAVKELDDAKLQLKKTQADLYAELHKGVRQRRENITEIDRLRETLAQYETFLELVVNANPNGGFMASAHVSLRGGQPLDQALASAFAQAAERDVETTSGDAAPPVLGLRTQDEYMAALQLTLKSRMQLRQCKKIAKFWKNTATVDGKNSNVVTPSPSAISSISEALPAERQKAVDELIARRKANARPSLCAESLLKTTMNVVPSTPSSILASSSHTSAHSRPCLSPLASQSLRQELKMSSNNRTSRQPASSALGRKSPRGVDADKKASVANTWKSTLQGGRHAPLAPLLLATRNQKAIMIGDPAHSATSYPFAPCNEPVASKKPHPGSVSGSMQPAKVRLLSDIHEEKEPQYEPRSRSDDTSQEQIISPCHNEDSFGSTAETLIHASPITPVAKHSASKTEGVKSRLPMPVFRSLKRLSSAKGVTQLSFLLSGDKVLTKSSPTRLPVPRPTKSQ